MRKNIISIHKILLFFFTILFQISLFINLDAKDTNTNIIIIAVDTLRADHLSCYGYPIKTSSAIDKLARDGSLFKRCFSLTPLTAPSFSTILTSLPAYKHGAKRNGLSIYHRIKTLPYYLKKEGYYSVAFISNWPLKKKLSHLNKYFDEYNEIFTKKRWFGLFQPEGKAEDVTKKAINWIEKNKNNKFFMWVHYTEPHAPYIKHKKFDYSSYIVKKEVYPPKSNIKKIKKYDSEVSYTDYHIGKFIDKLKEHKLYKNSLIIFLADHGESFGEHNYFKHGRRLYNSTINVPLIIKLPGNIKSNNIISKTVTLLDIAPTTLNTINASIPKTMEGNVLLKQNKDELHKDIFIETYRGAVHFKKSTVGQINVSPTYFGLIKYPFKIIAKIKFKNLRYKKIEVYNIENDFFETKNIWNKKSKELMSMSKTLKKHIYNIKLYLRYSKKHYKQNSKITKDDMEQLKTLGYIH
jgi:arylsulfatase A-like enzyme